MTITNEWRATIAILLLALILSIWGFGKYAGAGLLGAGIFKGVRMGLNNWDKEKVKK